MDISPLYETTEGIIALAVLIIGVVLLLACIMKIRNIYVAILATAMTIFGCAIVGAVLGYFDLPFIEYFNNVVAETVEPVVP